MQFCQPVRLAEGRLAVPINTELSMNTQVIAALIVVAAAAKASGQSPFGASQLSALVRPVAGSRSGADGSHSGNLSAALIKHRSMVLGSKASASGKNYFHLDGTSIRNIPAAALSPVPVTDPRVRQVFVQVYLHGQPLVVRGPEGTVGTVRDFARRPGGKPLTVFTKIEGVNLKVLNNRR